MKIGEYEQMMAHLKDSFNPSELRAKVAELEQRESFADGTKPVLSNKEFVKLRMEKANMNNKEFADFLNENYRPLLAKSFNTSSVDARLRDAQKRGNIPKDILLKGSRTNDPEKIKQRYIQMMGEEEYEKLKDNPKKLFNRYEYLQKKISDPDYLRKQREKSIARKRAMSPEEYEEKILQPSRMKKRELRKSGAKFYVNPRNALSMAWKDLVSRTYQAKGKNNYFRFETPIEQGKFYDSKDMKKIVLIDKDGNKYKYDSLFKNIEKTAGKEKAKFFKNVYEQRKFLNSENLTAELNKLYGIEPGQNKSVFNIQHIKGFNTDPFDVHLTFGDQNLQEAYARKSFTAKFSEAISKNKPYSVKKKIIQDYYTSLGPDIVAQIGKQPKGEAKPFLTLLEKVGVPLTEAQRSKANQLGFIDADLLKDIGRTAGSGALKTLAALDIPLLQLGFASMTDFAEDNPLMTTIPLMFTDEASKLTGLYNQSGGKFKKFMRLAARAGVPLEKAKTIFPMISKVGRIGSLATPALETVQEGYKAARNVSRAKEEARNFGIPEEQAMEGLEKMYALNRPVVGDYMDAPEMSERGKANLESLKRGFQQFGSFFGLSKDPYAMREQKAEGDKPKGAAKMTRRTFLKLASLVPAVLTGAAAIRFGPAKTKKIFTAIENLKETTTKLPTWFKGFADKFRNTGDSVNIYKKQKVPISKGEYERAELAKEANVYSDTARTLDYKKNNPHHMDYYRLVDTDELVGTTYTNKDMPGIQIDDFADGELSVKFENDYSQESELVYVKPGSKYSDYQVGDKRYMYEQFNPEETSKTKGDFIAYDSQPISTTPDGDYDIDAVVVDDVGNMLEGTTRSMEEYYTGKPVDEISAGEKQIMRAEMRAEDTPDDD